MYQLKIRNAAHSDDFKVIDVSEEDWLRWRDVFVKSNLCEGEEFDGDRRRLVISYYPGTLPVSDDDEEILDLL